MELGDGMDTMAFPPEALDRPGFDPDYAVKLWDITNRQDWEACESVQRVLASPLAQPGPVRCRPRRTGCTSSWPRSPAATRDSRPSS